MGEDQLWSFVATIGGVTFIRIFVELGRLTKGLFGHVSIVEGLSNL